MMPHGTNHLSLPSKIKDLSVAHGLRSYNILPVHSFILPLVLIYFEILRTMRVQSV